MRARFLSQSPPGPQAAQQEPARPEVKGEDLHHLGACRGGDPGADRGDNGGHYLAFLKVGSQTIVSVDYSAVST